MNEQENVEIEPINPSQNIEEIEEIEFDETEIEGEPPKEDNRFKEGQILRFVRVRFPGNSKSFPFLIGKRRIDYGQKVVAMSDRGMAVGYVNSFPYDVPFEKSMLPIKSISKVATDEDITKEHETYLREKEVETLCQDLIDRYQLDMYLTHVEFTQFGKKAVFYFIAPARVDFRDLVKDLVQQLKMRIELRQISVRDRSAALGGLGPCGRELCCSSFLGKYGNVSIKMAKNQDLTLNYSKLNGVCGQLKCCLQYEDEVYAEKRKRLPREGEIVMTTNGDVIRVDRLIILSEQFVGMSDRGIRKRFTIDMFKNVIENPKFPEFFDNISDETHKIIGLDETETKKVKKFEQEVKAYQDKSKLFAENVFEDLFGTKSLDYSLPEMIDPNEEKIKKVITPDEEDEIEYKRDASDDLDDDLDDDMDDEEDDRPVQQNRGPAPRHNNQNQNQNNNRPPQGQNNNNQNRRPDNRNNQNNQNRGPNPNANPNANANPNQNRNRPPQGQNNNNNQGPRNAGGPRPPQRQNNNPNRNNNNNGGGNKPNN